MRQTLIGSTNLSGYLYSASQQGLWAGAFSSSAFCAEEAVEPTATFFIHHTRRLHMKSYRTPELTQHGDIAQLTAIFGGAYTGDVLVNENGEVVEQGNQSIDACPTPDHEVCL